MNGQLVVVVGRVIVRTVAGPDRPNAGIGGHFVWVLGLCEGLPR